MHRSRLPLPHLRWPFVGGSRPGPRAALGHLLRRVPGHQGLCSGADGGGGVYVSGSVSSSTGLYQPGPCADAFVARYSAGGTLIWGRQIGILGNSETAFGVCADAAGSVFVAGHVSASFQYDAILARYTSSGDELWLRTFGTGAIDALLATCSDGAGGVYAAGNTSGDLAAPNAGSYDCFLVRYDASGTQLWARQFGTPPIEEVRCAIPDGSGGVYISGYTDGALGVSVGGTDLWLARYTSAGERLWILQFGSPLFDSMEGMCADGAGGLYVCGQTHGSFGGPAAGNKDAFLARLTRDGQLSWARQLGTSEPDYAQAVTADATGGVYLYGITWGALAGPNAGVYGDHFLARYTAAGERLWLRQWGTPLADHPQASAPDAAGGVYVAGWRTYSAGGGSLATLAHFAGPCYPNCDNSTAAPALNIADFTCFLQQFAAANPYTNCDQSTMPPMLNIADFTCFLQKFAAGCP
jgi:hypothetical protein